MEPLSVRQYRANLSAYFSNADKGQPVLIRRRGHIYALISVGGEDLTLSPELKKRISEAERNCKNGNCITCNTKDDLESFINSI